ncbi:hypothetical protein GYT97_03520 [Lactobacillus mellis]|uniref:hypothetical protein n=1 Tax=Bombilactobacillus mellis TaxID=1218508 RepID=UPI0015810DDB|nr:hypothetical protein [Bombilactobacillus mellis]NUG38948.1 hypothetical protein [Bombilactobacillus mellis]
MAKEKAINWNKDQHLIKQSSFLDEFVSHISASSLTNLQSLSGAESTSKLTKNTDGFVKKIINDYSVNQLLNFLSQPITPAIIQEVRVLLRKCASRNKHIHLQLNTLLQKFNQSLVPVFSNQSFQQELQQKLGVSSAVIRKAIKKLNHYLKNDPNTSTSTAVILLFITLGASLVSTSTSLGSANIFLLVTTVLDYVTDIIQLASLFQNKNHSAL